MIECLTRQLELLLYVCEAYFPDDKRAKLVPYALSRYIFSCRAPKYFERGFMMLSSEELKVLIEKALHNDLSDDGIVKTTKIFLKLQEGAGGSWKR